MRIAVIGVGGVGGYFGGLLAHTGFDVTFLARGASLRAIQENGLVVHSVFDDFTVKPAQVSDDPEAIGPVELVLVAVKDYQLDPVIQQMEPLVDANTTILPLLNGVRAAHLLADHFGQSRSIGGLCRVFAHKSAPGVIEHQSEVRSVTFGEWDGQVTPRSQTILEMWQKTGIQATLTTNIQKAMWTKFLLITAYSGMGSIVRLPIGKIRATPETMALLIQAVDEIVAVAKARDIELDDDVVEKTIAFLNALPDDAIPSMQRDVQAGHMFELEALTGTVIRYGAVSGVSTPVNQFIYGALKPHLPRDVAA